MQFARARRRSAFSYFRLAFVLLVFVKHCLCYQYDTSNKCNRFFFAFFNGAFLGRNRVAGHASARIARRFVADRRIDMRPITQKTEKKNSSDCHDASCRSAKLNASTRNDSCESLACAFSPINAPVVRPEVMNNNSFMFIDFSLLRSEDRCRRSSRASQHAVCLCVVRFFAYDQSPRPLLRRHP